MLGRHDSIEDVTMRVDGVELRGSLGVPPVPIGLVIFVLSFGLIGITVGPSLVHRASMQTVSLDRSAAAASLEVGRALVDQRCGRCHSLDRVYKTIAAPEAWQATVTQMAGFAEGSANGFQPGEDQQIITYLSATQTPDAVDHRKTVATAASSSGRATETQEVSASRSRRR